jgi:biopolymer transport protein ExbB/TolQ
MHLDVALDYFLKFLALLTLALAFAKMIELWEPFGWFSRPVDEKEIDNWLERRERALTLMATIASTGPFIGLAGTITRMIHALGSMSSANGDIGVISGPIAMALYSTLWGLASAIPAGVAYNLCVRRLQVLEARVRRACDVATRNEGGAA